MDWNKEPINLSFEVENTPENQESVNKLMGELNEAHDAEVLKIVKMLEDACVEEAKKWNLGNYGLIDDSSREVLVRILRAGAHIGWNKHYEYLSNEIKPKRK